MMKSMLLLALLIQHTSANTVIGRVRDGGQSLITFAEDTLNNAVDTTTNMAMAEEDTKDPDEDSDQSGSEKGDGDSDSDSSEDSEAMSSDGKLTLVYWPMFCKNIAPAVAMELANLDWEMGPGPGSKGTGNLWAEWLEMKPHTVWGYLPNLQLAGGKTVGTELAILQYLARKAPVLAGVDDNEFLISQNLLHQSEELYQKFVQKFPTITAMDKSPEEFSKFVEGSDKETHSSVQGLQVYLAQFEDFYTKNGGADGKFTASGTTIGEIKLCATLKMLLFVKADALASYANLTAFMANMGGNEKVKSVFEGTAKNMQGPLPPYFIAPPGPGIA